MLQRRLRPSCAPVQASARAPMGWQTRVAWTRVLLGTPHQWPPLDPCEYPPPPPRVRQHRPCQSNGRCCFRNLCGGGGGGLADHPRTRNSRTTPQFADPWGQHWVPGRGGGGWHKASGSDCLPLAAPIGLSPPPILTLCGPERVLVVSTEPPDDVSCLTTPGVGGGGGALGTREIGNAKIWHHSRVPQFAGAL